MLGGVVVVWGVGRGRGVAVVVEAVACGFGIALVFVVEALAVLGAVDAEEVVGVIGANG